MALAAFAASETLPPSFLREFGHLLWQWILTALLLLWGLRLAPLPLQSLGRRTGKILTKLKLPSDTVLLVLGFVFFAGLCSLLSGLLFNHIPHVNDSINQYIHAKFIAGGYIAIPPPPLKEFFDSGWMMRDELWYSPYSPAHIVLLGLGHFIGMPWLINPLLGACTLLAVYALARELYGNATARLAGLLFCLCPLIIFMSSEYMNHATALLFTTLFTLFFLRMLRTRYLGDACFAGGAFGLVALTRPLTALGIALPFAIIGLYKLCREWRHFKPFLAFLLVVGLCMLFQLWWNAQTTGDPFTVAYHKMMGDAHMPGLGKNPWGEEHTLANGFKLAAERLMSLNAMLFEWPVPSLAFVLMLALSGTLMAIDGTLLAVIASVFFVYLFFQGHSEAFGPRYVYETAGLLIILTAAAISRWPSILRHTGSNISARTVHGMAAILLTLLFVLALPNLSHRYRIYSTQYWEGDVDYYRSIVNAVRKPALVFVPFSEHDHTYLKVAFTLPPSDEDTVIFANDRGEENPRLIEYYPCRHAYLALETQGLLLLHNPDNSCAP